MASDEVPQLDGGRGEPDALRHRLSRGRGALVSDLHLSYIAIYMHLCT